MSNKPEAINKVRFLIVGQPAPKKSVFKGIITAETIFGKGSSKQTTVWKYTTRYSENDGDNELNKNSLFDYEGRYKKNMENFTMTSEGRLKTKDEEEEFRKNGYEAMSKDGKILWEFIFSPKDIETSDKYHLSNQTDYSVVVSKIMPEYLKSCGFEPNNIVWWENYHPDNRNSIEPHPHIHLSFYEKEQTRTRGKLTMKDLNRFKRYFAKEMLKREDSSKYKAILKNIDENKSKVIEYSKKFKLDKIDSIVDLYKVLPSSGRLQYNSANMINYRPAIDRVVDQLLNSDECKEAWNNLNKSLDEYEEAQNKKFNSNIANKKEIEVKKVKEQIANYILSEKKNFIEENNYKKSTHSKSGKISHNPLTIRNNLKRRGKDVSKFHSYANTIMRNKQKEIEEYLKNKDKENEYEY